MDTTSEALVTTTAAVERPPRPSLPTVPWRDPYTVSPEDLAGYIQTLERACLEDPRSADLRTCLGMAHAVNYDAYRSMDALEEAVALDPDHFWAQVKYGELHYRLRALPKAEAETLKAVALAENPWQLTIARKQLQEIRNLRKTSVRNVHWTKPLKVPALVFSAMILMMFVVMMWR